MNNIKLLRKSKNLSQIELAEKMNVHQTSVSQWELGKTYPDMAQAIQLAEFFQVSVDYILGRVDEPTPELIIPEELKGAKVAFHRGAFEDLTQYEVDRLAEFARFIKSQRKDNK